MRLGIAPSYGTIPENKHLKPTENLAVPATFQLV